ncbi:Epoxide hydrolase [Gracilaria domingensis]|nr:Epoxide hydrolase [Gracilaria domingensis]
MMMTSWTYNGFLVFGIWLGCVTMPLRYLGAFPKPPEEEPKVKIFVHEPSKDSKDGSKTTPRDTLLLIHGYPDNQNLWDKTVKACTEKGYRCLVAALPGANGENVPRALSFRETADLIKESLEGVTDQAMTVIGHDWGSVYSRVFQVKYPSLCKRMILLDVGGMKFGSDVHWSTWYSIFSYQLVFALAFWLGRPVGTWLMKLQLRTMLGDDRRVAPRPLNEITCDMGYHYASLFESFAQGRDAFETSGDPIPHLYVYGAKKPFNFHDSGWLNFVRSTRCGEVASLPCVHWLMHEEPEALHKIMLDWLDKSCGCVNEE